MIPLYLLGKTEEKAMKDSLLKKYLRIFLVVASYWSVSILLIFVNKTLLSGQLEDSSLDAPMFVTWFQCVVTVGLCLFLAVGAKCFPSLSSIPEIGFSFRMMFKVLPYSILFVIMISFNNFCLKHVGVAFYYIGRSLTTVFNVMMTWAWLGERTSKSTLACCSIIVMGFLLGVDQETIAGSLSVTGTLCGVAASFFVSVTSIYTKKVLPYVENSVYLLGFYNNLNACLLFLPLIVLNEEVATISSFTAFDNCHFWMMMSAGGVFGFAIGYVSGLQIQFTSPLTHNISSTAKGCAQTLLATYHYSESKQMLWWLSNGIVLFGSAAYTRVRQVEMKKKHKTT